MRAALREQIRKQTDLSGISKAWAPPKKLKPSEWAEQNRVIAPYNNPEPGPYSFQRTPYMRGISDAITEPGVQEVVFLKAVQVGFSTLTQNLVGYFADNDPGPCLFVLPDEKSAKRVLTDELLPTFEGSPALARHLSERSHDTTSTVIKLDTMPIEIAWSGSASSLGARRFRYVFFDEPDKYKPFAGNDADAISLGVARTTTFTYRSRCLFGSTPTTRTGNIWRLWEGCGQQRHYQVPCPHCKKYQPLTFPQIKWVKAEEVIAETKTKIAETIRQKKQVWYECGNCQGRIEDRHKPTMLLRGVWANQEQTVNDAGEIVGPRRISRRVGFQLPILYSPWKTFSDIAAQFILAKGDEGAAMEFRNQWLAEPYEEIHAKPQPSLVREKSLSAPSAGVVPSWATALIVSVDSQKDHFHFGIRAWGHQWRSQLVRIGLLKTFAEVYGLLELSFLTDVKQIVRPNLLIIDTGGNRTEEIYKEILNVRDGRIIPIKGGSHGGQPYKLSELSNGIPLRILNTDFYKDMLYRLLTDNDTKKWQLV